MFDKKKNRMSFGKLQKFPQITKINIVLAIDWIVYNHDAKRHLAISFAISIREKPVKQQSDNDTIRLYADSINSI